MLEDPQHDLPQVPLVEIAPALEQLRRGVLLSGLVLGPRLAPVPAGLVLFLLLLLLLLRTAARKETREHEYRFDVKFFERSQVGLDTGGERERETASRGEQGLSGGRLVRQRREVVGCIDAQTRVGENGQGMGLEMLPLDQIVYGDEDGVRCAACAVRTSPQRREGGEAAYCLCG